MKPSVLRDLAIDAALHVLIRLKDPYVSNADIQKRSRMDISEDGYAVYFDDSAIAIVHLLGETSFSLLALT